MKQSSLGLSNTTKRTRKREFLDAMELVVPWAELVALICEGALPRTQEEHAADRHAVCAGQLVDGQAQVAGDGTGACAAGVKSANGGLLRPEAA